MPFVVGLAGSVLGLALMLDYRRAASRLGGVADAGRSLLYRNGASRLSFFTRIYRVFGAALFAWSLVVLFVAFASTG